MRDEVAALVFGPGLPPGGAQGTLAISSLGVEVMAGQVAQHARVGDITLREVGFDKPGIEIAWIDAGQAWAAHVLDHACAQRLLGSSVLAATEQAAKLKSAQRRNLSARSIGWSLLALFVLLPAILLALLVFNASAIAGWVANKIPVEQEMDFGRQAFAGMQSTLKLQDQGPAFDDVQAIVARLTKGSKYRYQVHVAKDDTLNAFAMPGGIVVVHTGLIAATKRPEELAGVLAHEIQHVELRHSIRGTIKELGLRGLWSAVTGDLGKTIAGQAALEMTSLKFSRDDESEADDKGFDALLRAGIDPAGMPAFFKTMSEQAKDAPAAILSTHPLSVDRQQELQQRLEQVRGRKFAALEFGPWPPPTQSIP